MIELDIAIRAVSGALILMLAVFLLRDMKSNTLGVYLLLIAIGLSAFLLGNTQTDMFAQPGPVKLIRDVLSGHLALFIWWFCLKVFDDDFRIRRLEIGVALVWTCLFFSRYLQVIPDSLNWGAVIVGLFIVGHVSWRLLADKGIDLVETRRRSRLFVASAPVLLLSGDLLIDILFGFDWKPIGFTLFQNSSILLIIVGICFWGLQASTDRITFSAGNEQWAGQDTASVCPEASSKFSSADQRIYEKLVKLLEEEHIYLDADLKVPNLAAQLGIGEVRMRDIIRRGFGYRNFKQFLNTYRLKFACTRLVDPRHAEDKILSIALDSGFASLASFNRVFKDQKGIAPTEYRQRLSQDKSVLPTDNPQK